MEIFWTLRFFKELTPYEVYRILNLRNEVFVMEQSCLFLDTDEKDLRAWHLMGWNAEGELCAYARLLPGGIAYEVPSIGRVVTASKFRQIGLGKQLMYRALMYCRELFGPTPLKIGAQLYLKEFYASFGFFQSGPIYLEDGIEHLEMTKLYID
jgi:ElaA protein